MCAPLILRYEYLNRPLPVRWSAVAYGKTQFSELKNSFWTLTQKQVNKNHKLTVVLTWTWVRNSSSNWAVYSVIHKAVGLTVPGRSMTLTGTIAVEWKNVHWLWTELPAGMVADNPEALWIALLGHTNSSQPPKILGQKAKPLKGL